MTASHADPPLLTRALMPDLVRAFALAGICLVNAAGFAWPFSTLYYDGGLATAADRAAYFAVSSLFLMKSYPLFSMMFGAGLTYQMQSATRAQADFAPRYFRRMAVLAVLGSLHFIFFWMGDILLTYALLGCVLFAMRETSVKVLVVAGTLLIGLNTLVLGALGGLVWLGETYAPELMADAGYDDMTADETAAFGSGSFPDAAAYRLGMLPLVLPGVLLQQGIAVFGFFCFGLAAAKAGIIDRPDAPLWRRARTILLPVGLIGSAFGAWILLEADSAIDSRMYAGMAVLMAFSAPAALGYAGLIAKVSMRAGPLRGFLAKAGSASLSAYLLQSVALSLVFCGYGLGLFATLGAAAVTAIALVVAAGSLILVAIWRSFLARGPFEILLRRITYMERT